MNHRLSLVFYKALYNGGGSRKQNWSAEVLDDPVLVGKFDQQRKVFTKQMQDRA